MRILLLTQIVPNPPDSGPKIKTISVLRYLAQAHEVHLVSFARSAQEEACASVLRSLCASVTTVPLRRSRARDLIHLARSLASGRPFLIERDDSRAMRHVIAGLLQCHVFEAVHADQLGMAQFAVDLPLRIRVLDEHNAVWTIVRRAASREGYGPRRLLMELEWRKLRAYEGAISRRFDHLTVVSEEDRLALEAAAGTPLHAAVIPIAVDTTALMFHPRSSRARNVLSVATMFYPPNIEGIMWFAQLIFPLVRQAAPDTRFLVVGSRPPAQVQRLAALDSGIVVTGYVEDLEPILAESAVLVVPLHSGSGMRVKILEAFARGVPVVSTSIGVEGVPARAGEHLLVADEPTAFALAVIQLLRDRRLGANLTAAARDLVQNRYDWRTALVGLDAMYPRGGEGSAAAFRARRDVEANWGGSRDLSSTSPQLFDQDS